MEASRGQVLSEEQLNLFSTKYCENKAAHDHNQCLFWHREVSPHLSPELVAVRHLRRPPLRPTPFGKELAYSDVYCQFEGIKNCPHGDACDRCHNEKEFMYHPFVYMTKECRRSLAQCPNRTCAFFHTDEQRREAERHRERLEQELEATQARKEKATTRTEPVQIDLSSASEFPSLGAGPTPSSGASSSAPKPTSQWAQRSVPKVETPSGTQGVKESGGPSSSSSPSGEMSGVSSPTGESEKEEKENDQKDHKEHKGEPQRSPASSVMGNGEGGLSSSSGLSSPPFHGNGGSTHVPLQPSPGLLLHPAPGPHSPVSPSILPDVQPPAETPLFGPLTGDSPLFGMGPSAPPRATQLAPGPNSLTNGPLGNTLGGGGSGLHEFPSDGFHGPSPSPVLGAVPGEASLFADFRASPLPHFGMPSRSRGTLSNDDGMESLHEHLKIFRLSATSLPHAPHVQVYRGTWQQDGRVQSVLVKQVPLFSPAAYAVAKERVQALCQWRHPAILTPCGLVAHAEGLWVAVPHMNTSLALFCEQSHALLLARQPTELCCALVLQFFTAMQHLHQQGLVHHHLRVENIFLEESADGRRHLILGDPETYLAPTWGSGEARNNLREMGQVLFFLLFRQRAPESLAACAQRFPLEEAWRYWKSLVMVLLGMSPREEVDMSHLHSHPIFWIADPRRSYQFLSRTVTSYGPTTLNQLCESVPIHDWLGGAEGWKSSLPPEMVHMVRDYKNYKAQSVADLLRVILLTVREIESPLKSSSSHPPNPHVEKLRASVFGDVHQIVQYFQRLFPNLTALLWEVLFFSYSVLQRHDHTLRSLLFSSSASSVCTSTAGAPSSSSLWSSASPSSSGAGVMPAGVSMASSSSMALPTSS